MTHRVLLVDDHKLVRDGIRSLLEEGGFTVIAEAGDGRSAIKLAQEHQPDVILMDITMPDLNGIDACYQILKIDPAARIIFLSMHIDHHFVKKALQAGALGYLLKDSGWQELKRAIDTVLDGEKYLSTAVTTSVVDDYVGFVKSEQSSDLRATKLTPRENEVLQLIVEGKSTKAISKLLHVSVKTVESHRKQLMTKLKIQSIAELTKYAIKEGLTPLS